MAYIVRGKIGLNRDNVSRVGQFTYLATTGDLYVWDGPHKASRFESAEAGLAAADQCNGPWFNIPDPTTIESVECLGEQLPPEASRLRKLG